jgi:hypothetical protein
MNLSLSVYNVSSVEMSEIRKSHFVGVCRTIIIESMIDGKTSTLEITLHSQHHEDEDLERKMLEVSL